MSEIIRVGRALPEHYYSQEALLAALKSFWASRHHNLGRLASIHQNVRVGGRHLALPIEEYPQLQGFTDTNNAFIRTAVPLGAQAINDALEKAALSPQDIDHIFFVSVTGIATPSIDARLVNRLGFRTDIKRTPIFGLGCVAGAAGLARAHDYLAAYPQQVALLLSVELCSLTLQQQDLTVPNIVASGLFGDGAAAAVLVGKQHALAGKGPKIVATKSVFYPNTEHVMGWDITSTGFKVVLSAEVPTIAQKHVGKDVDSFLAEQGLQRQDIQSFVCHPGGPKVLEGLSAALGLGTGDLAITWKSLNTLGNLSSASVLMVLADTMDEARPAPDTYGLLLAMGPGFCTELVLLRW